MSSRVKACVTFVTALTVAASIVAGCSSNAAIATQPAPTSSPISATPTPATVIASPRTPADPTPLANESGTPQPTARGVVALGHSALTGEGSDPSRPGQEARNSWATGTNREVNSIYQRLVAHHPGTEGQVANAAEAGAPASRLAGQARTALASVGAPQLVIIQSIDGDIRCDGTDDTHVPEFGTALQGRSR